MGSTNRQEKEESAEGGKEGKEEEKADALMRGGSMSDIFIYWDEIEDGAFPDCCMTCGCDDTDLVPRFLETRPWGPLLLTLLLRKSCTAELPFCVQHRSRPWFRWGRTDAREITAEGIWMKNVSPAFVEEMEIYREEGEDHEHRRRKRKRGRKRSRDRDDDDDRDDRDEREPFSNPGRRTPQPASSGGSSAGLYVVLVLVAVPVLLGVTCCVAGVVQNGGKFEVKRGNQPPPPMFNPPR
jgi:hypothetical protein